MSLTKFVRNVEDLSDSGGYKFRFRCDQCGDGYDSEYVSSSANVLKTAVEVFAVFTHSGWGAREVANDLDRGLRGKEHDAAYERAVAQAMSHFKKCSACGKWVCPEACWNEPAGLCEHCAPDAREEAGKRAAQRKVEQAVARAAAGEEVSSITCPTCGAQLRAASKFCEQCGVRLGERQCTHCHAPLAASARFCGECGQAQT